MFNVYNPFIHSKLAVLAKSTVTYGPIYGPSPAHDTRVLLSLT